MAQIRMSESELRELASKIQKQQQNIADVTSAGNSAVGAASADWQSTAFDTFKGRWSQDKSVLDRLAADLTDWNRKLNDHAAVAGRVNRPFA